MLAEQGLDPAQIELEVRRGVGLLRDEAEQALEAADSGADGVIVGTRLVRAAAEAEDPATAVGALVGELAAALSRDR